MRPILSIAIESLVQKCSSDLVGISRKWHIRWLEQIAFGVTAPAWESLIENLSNVPIKLSILYRSAPSSFAFEHTRQDCVCAARDHALTVFPDRFAIRHPLPSLLASHSNPTCGIASASDFHRSSSGIHNCTAGYFGYMDTYRRGYASRSNNIAGLAEYAQLQLSPPKA